MMDRFARGVITVAILLPLLVVSAMLWALFAFVRDAVYYALVRSYLS